MTKRDIVIKRQFDYENNFRLEFNYYGHITKQSMPKEKIDALLNNIFATRKIVPSITETAKILKTIFTSLEESYLEIYVEKEKDVVQGALYYENKLNIYYYHQHSNLLNKIDYEIEYDRTKGTKFTTTKELMNVEEYKKIFDREINNIQNLQNIKPISLTDNDKAICTIYHLFYQENPNFSKIEDRIKAQSMFALLAPFNITLGDRDTVYSFSLNVSKTMVLSQNLVLDLAKIAPLGEISESIGFIKLSDWSIQTIETVGQVIRNHMNQQTDPTNWIRDLVKIDHIKNYCLSSKSSRKDIADYSNCSENTVANSQRLIKEINKKVYN